MKCYDRYTCPPAYSEMAAIETLCSRSWFSELAWLSALLLCLCSFAPAFSQDKDPPAYEELKDLQALNKEFLDYTAEGKEFEATYERLKQVFAETEQEFLNIRNQAQRQQMAMDFNSIQMANLPPPALVTGNNDWERRNAQLQQQIAAANRSRLMLDNFMRSQDLQQLSVAQQGVLRKRLQAMTDWERLQREIGPWQAKWIEFFSQYWRFTDPEGSFPMTLKQQLESELAQCEKSNTHAQIARGLLQLRLGSGEDALRTLDPITQTETALTPIANAAKAWVYAHADQTNKSKVELRKAIAKAGNNPYVIWLKAQTEWSLDQFTDAKRDFERLIQKPEFEIPARRQSALLTSIVATKRKQDLDKAVSNARVASDFNSGSDWYSELVLAVALYAREETPDAVEQAKKALKLATDDQTERTTEVIASLESESPIDWKQIRR